MVITQLETRHYTFVGTGWTEKEAQAALLAEVNRHIASVKQSDPSYDGAQLRRWATPSKDGYHEFNTEFVTVGRGFTDHSPETTSVDAMPVKVAGQSTPLNAQAIAAIIGAARDAVKKGSDGTLDSLNNALLAAGVGV
jgi:hypothetical protein